MSRMRNKISRIERMDSILLGKPKYAVIYGEEDSDYDFSNDPLIRTYDHLQSIMPFCGRLAISSNPNCDNIIYDSHTNTLSSKKADWKITLEEKTGKVLSVSGKPANSLEGTVAEVSQFYNHGLNHWHGLYYDNLVLFTLEYSPGEYYAVGFANIYDKLKFDTFDFMAENVFVICPTKYMPENLEQLDQWIQQTYAVKIMELLRERELKVSFPMLSREIRYCKLKGEDML